jgi:hypothetical protein
LDTTVDYEVGTDLLQHRFFLGWWLE